MKTLRCPRCTVTHRVRTAPSFVKRPLPVCESPKCKLPYWDSMPTGATKFSMNVDPENVQQWLDAGCIMEEK